MQMVFREADMDGHCCNGCCPRSLGIALEGAWVKSVACHSYAHLASVVPGSRVVCINGIDVSGDGSRFSVVVSGDEIREVAEAVQRVTRPAQPLVLDTDLRLHRVCVPRGWLIDPLSSELCVTADGARGAPPAWLGNLLRAEGPVEIVFYRDGGSVEEWWCSTALAFRGQPLEVTFSCKVKEDRVQRALANPETLAAAVAAAGMAPKRKVARPAMSFRHILNFSIPLQADMDDSESEEEDQATHDPDRVKLGHSHAKSVWAVGVLNFPSEEDRLRFARERVEVLDWINSTYCMNVRALRQCANGAVYLQIMDSVFPRVVAMKHVNWNATPDDYPSMRSNYEMLRAAFKKCLIRGEFDLRRLCGNSEKQTAASSRAVEQANLEMLLLLKKVWDSWHIRDYNPVARRDLGRSRSKRLPTWAIPSPLARMRAIAVEAVWCESYRPTKVFVRVVDDHRTGREAVIRVVGMEDSGVPGLCDKSGHMAFADGPRVVVLEMHEDVGVDGPVPVAGGARIEILYCKAEHGVKSDSDSEDSSDEVDSASD
mmetsp:Transcript_47006/g.124491  ORF Transcript_47006/g.124491 Transcript_47006/m.124491 type:complete len:541 (+) Transcript_47006:1925-3547(+)